MLSRSLTPPLQTYGALANLQRDIYARYVRAKDDNPRTRAIMATPPAVTVGTTAPASQTTQWPASPAAASDFAPIFKVNGAGWTPFRSNDLTLLPRSACADSTVAIDRTTASSGSGYSNATGAVYSAEVMIDAPIWSWQYNQGQTSLNYAPIKIIVDGQYTNAVGYNNANANFQAGFINFDFTSAGGRALRRVRMESCQDNGPGVIWTAATDTVFAPTELTTAPRVLLITDSYGYGTGATAAVDGIGLQLQHYLGNPNVIINAVSGSGYLVAHGTGHDCAIDRINAGDVAAVAPDAIVVCLGLNDIIALQAGSITRANFQARLLLTFQALRAAAPRAPIVVFGPWTPATACGATLATYTGQVDDDIAAAVATMADPRIASVRTYRRYGFNYPTSTKIKPVLWGTGYSGAAAGTGSNDNCTAADATHQVSYGYGVLARYVSGEFVGALLGMS